ncbi:N-formylglutamate amidohydrolase [Altererythrobacter aquiaggeris]|uniref:N-formylglutamate amidohydrolase n=1 Tax=Aestuarierythrobacter aquiaggeris TaxID=1898396 RepID=UPI003019E0CF
MNEMVYRRIGSARRGGIVCIGDHASNAVPEDIDLGIAAGLLDNHIAVDIGVEGVTSRLALQHGIAAHIAAVSRLVCDLHRHEHENAVVPVSSDGHAIPGNIGADIESRLATFHRPYHSALADWLGEIEPALIIAVHSFTPVLESKREARPWEVALLYNQDERAARHAIKLFQDEGLCVGDNEPYSGKQLNATMDRHAELAGRPYLTIEIRQDQIADDAGQIRWARLLASVAAKVEQSLRVP